MGFLRGWMATEEWLRSLKPSWVNKYGIPRLKNLNFIILHNVYLIVMTIIGSVILYGAKNMDYTDALFFAAGSATQSGLNTLDVNTLFLYQQVTFYLIACVTNPIFINTFVVFVRLYWFEKRFQHVVQEARTLRRTRTRSFGRQDNKEEADVERGVRGRPIVVQRDTDGAALGHAIDSDSDRGEKPLENGDGEKANGNDIASNGKGKTNNSEAETQPFHRDIMFADEVDPVEDRVPQNRTKEQHIAFVENQRDPKRTRTLRIPGPREFDAGEKPEQVEENDDGHDLGRKVSKVPDSATSDPAPTRLNWDDHPVKESIQEENEPSSSRLARGLAHFHIPLPGSRAGRDGSVPDSLRSRARTWTMGSALTSRSQEKEARDPMPYLSYAATVGRNSFFVDLTEEQREELGGIEYRSLKTLAVVLICYFIGFHILGVIVLTPWILRDSAHKAVVVAVGQNPSWWGIFTSASMFNDLGFTLTADSMLSFQTAVLPMIFGSFLIVIGNTGFPCMLRFVIWVASKCVTHGSPLWEEFRFLLDHPRRCFTLLFPSKATWWLFTVLVILNGIDLLLFIILDLNDPTVTSLSPGYRVLDGLFQAFSTRTAGFACVNLADLHPGIQVSYLIMMYISVFPIAISVRRTNVYEEKSLGIYGSGHEEDEEDENKSKRVSYVGAHLRNQLSFDLWYICLGLFFICIIEGSRISDNTGGDVAFTQFTCLFEIVSAYGTVGLSLGYPNSNASFSAQFHPLSKLIIAAMMIRGRHRGLPYALDRAILLPSESLQRKEQDEAVRLVHRRNSALSLHPPPTGEDAHKGATTAERGRRVSVSSEKRGLGISKIVTGALSAGPTHRSAKKYH